MAHLRSFSRFFEVRDCHVAAAAKSTNWPPAPSVLSSIPESAEHLAHPHDRVVDDPATSIRLDVRGGVPGTVSAGRRYW